MDCIFCKIATGEIPSHTVYEDDRTLAFLDISPASRGHTLVIPKTHAADLLSIGSDDAAAVGRSVQVVARILHTGLQPDGINVIQNNGAAAGQTAFHYHVHVIPRWDGDGALRLWTPGATDHPALSALAAKLRAVEGSD